MLMLQVEPKLEYLHLLVLVAMAAGGALGFFYYDIYYGDNSAGDFACPHYGALMIVTEFRASLT